MEQMESESSQSSGKAVYLNTETLFIYSTSGSQSSIVKHNEALQSLGLNVVYYSIGKEIGPEEYSGALRAPFVRGGAVTGQGLKTEIIPYLDELETLARQLNAVNTVINQEGKLHGYNTDAFGLETALLKQKEAGKLDVSKAVIYGYGGVSGVAAFALKNLGIQTTLTGRDIKRAEEKMQQLGLSKIDGPYDFVLNATPVSASPLEEAEGFLDLLDDAKLVFDHNMPEKDERPNYLKEYCEKRGIHFIPGQEMYIPQMIKQWNLFLGLSDEEIKKHWDL